jgi:hypothetical protein
MSSAHRLESHEKYTRHRPLQLYTFRYIDIIRGIVRDVSRIDIRGDQVNGRVDSGVRGVILGCTHAGGKVGQY